MTESEGETVEKTETPSKVAVAGSAREASLCEHELVVSIINYRTGEMTRHCVEAVLADLGDLDAHVVVVDNCSNDGSAEMLERWLAELGDERVTLIRSPTNTGFAGGHNIGIAVRRGAAYLILNSDALAQPGMLRTLLERLRADLQLGIVAPRLVGEDGEPQVSCFRLPSPMSELIRGAASGPVTRLLRRWEVPLSADPEPSRIGWVSFACVLLRRETLETVGGLDDGYFLYFDDVDYCHRAREAGWRIAYVPEAHIVHLRGGSGPVKTLAKARRRLPPYWYASRTRFLHKAYGWPGLVAANLLWHLGRGFARLRPLVGCPVPAGAEHEARDLWINALSPRGDRRAPEA